MWGGQGCEVSLENAKTSDTWKDGEKKMMSRERSIQSVVDNRWFKGACGQSRGGGQGGVAGLGWVPRRVAGALRCAGFTRVAGATVLSNGRGTPMWAAALFRRHSYRLTSEVVMKKRRR